MNVFGVSAVASPLFGAIAGGMSVRASGVIPALCGVGLGLVTGTVLYFAAIGLSALMLWISGVNSQAERLSPLQWLASLAGFLISAASPFAAWALAGVVVLRLLH
jgi:hypothetical protein